MAVNIARILNIVILAGLAVAWIIMLAGVAKVNDTCVKVAKGQALPFSSRKLLGLPMGAHGRQLLGSVEENCGMQVSLYWWIVFLQLFTLLGCVLLGFDLKLVSKWKKVVRAFMYIVTTLLCIMANDFVKQSYSFQNRSGNLPDGLKVTAAGTVLTLVFNFLWIIVNVGKEDSLKATLPLPGGKAAVHDNHGHTAAHTAGHTTGHTDAVAHGCAVTPAPIAHA